MNQKATLNSALDCVTTLVSQYSEALDGIPEADLNTWKPSAEQQGGGPMNTMAAICVHVVAAARWRIEQQLFDQPYVRHRETEFTATASRGEIDAMFAELLTNFRVLIDSGREINLFSLPTVPREDHPDWTRFDWLVSAIGHTSLHLGHAQIHRQLWLAERAHTP